MPEISEAAGYLVALLHSAGMATPTGMGLIGLSWQEIEAWARCNDFVTDSKHCRCIVKRGMRPRKKIKRNRSIVGPRELRAVYLLSRAYAGEMSTATKKDAKAPYVPIIEVEEAEVVREMVAEKVEDVFAAMMAAQKRD